jgi:hypothetical protein
MLWDVLLGLGILVLGLLMAKAAKGTPFGKNCPCAGNVEHLRWMEDADAKPAAHTGEQAGKRAAGNDAAA